MPADGELVIVWKRFQTATLTMPNPAYIFGEHNEYELNGRLPELRRDGEVVKIDGTPLRILLHLIENRGHFHGVGILEELFGTNVQPETWRGNIHKIYEALGGRQQASKLITNDRHKRYCFIGEAAPVSAETVAPQHVLTPFETMLVAHRIQQTSEPEFEQFLQIFSDELQDQIDDTPEDFETYLQNAKAYAERDPPSDDIYLVAKFAGDRQLKGVVAAILYAAYYPTLGFVLISCVALNVKLYEQLQLTGDHAAATEIRHKAINLLLRSLKNIVNGDVAVVAEVNEDGRAEYKKTLFASYANRLFNSQLYEIKFPLGYPFDLDDDVEPAYLLYVPSRRQQEMISKIGDYLPRDDAIALLYFLYNSEYSEYYKNIGQSDLFFDKVRTLFDRLRQEFPALIPLVPLRSRALLRLNQQSTA